MQQIKAHRTLSRRRAWPLAIIAGGVVVAGLPTKTNAASTCTDVSCPTDFIQLTSPEIQSTKSSFKFQARISQAKLPVGDITFQKVIVKLRDSVTTWCSQSLSGVKVRDSVINVEVGPDTGMTCSMPLEDLIAGKNGLSFQICINNEENCLKPVALSSVPYAVKAEYARRAQQSFEADVAAQAHYAHRIAADLDLLQAPTIGTGYYDFHTPLAALVIPGLNATISNREGVMEWTPVATAEKKLNILLKTDANGAVPASYSRLDELKLHAVVTRDLGKLEVSEGAKMFSTLDVTGATTMANTLTVAGATTINNTLTAKLAATMQATLQVNGATTMGTAATTNVLLTNNGASALNGATTMGAAATTNVLLTNNGASLLKGETTVSNNLKVTGTGVISVAGTGANSFGGSGTFATGLAVTSGATVLGGTLDVIAGQSKLSNLYVPGAGGKAVFDGDVTFNGAVNLPSAGLSTPTLSVSGNASVAGTSSFSGVVTVPVGGLRMGSSGNVVLGDSSNAIGTSVNSTIGGGGWVVTSSSPPVSYANSINAAGGTISGGGGNSITANLGVIGGGLGNAISAGQTSVIGGGYYNAASGSYSVIGGGFQNSASGASAVVAGGASNNASGTQAGILAGYQNNASGTNAMIPGGYRNIASGDTSFAAGRRAQSTAIGAFTWGDSSDVDLVNSTANSFKVRASGGVWFYTSSMMPGVAAAGVTVPAGGGAWANISDRNLKHDVSRLDPKQVLAKLDAVPVATWRYKSEESQALHMGPMAQDFYAAFGLGDDDKHISTIDADGVALAAVKGVHEVTKEQHKELDELKGEVKVLRDQNKSLEARLAKLESSGGGRSSSQGLNIFGSLGVMGFAGLGAMLVAGRRRKELL